jgi:hypothetical protein
MNVKYSYFQAEKLEVALTERNREVHNLRLEVQNRPHKQHTRRTGHHWFSEQGISASMGSLQVSVLWRVLLNMHILL